MIDLTSIQQKLSKKLDEKRYTHTIGVMYTAASLAMRYNESIETAMTAGLLHDCGKFPSIDKQIQLCEKYHLQLTDAELQVPALIHAKLGSVIAKEVYGIHDKRILDAILYHTTGKPNMNLLEKIRYLADYIEPGRRMIPGLPEVRTLSFTNIDEAVCLCSSLTLQYLDRAGRAIDPMTRQTYEFYLR